MEKILLLSFALILQIGYAQVENEELKSGSGIIFFTGSEVINAEDAPEKQIIELWKSYLLEGKFQDDRSPYWSFDDMKIPDEYLWAVGVQNLNSRKYKVQCKIIGVFPAENDFYALKSAFTHIDDNGEIHLDTITSVYAKKFNDKYLLISSAEYFKSVLEHHKIGNINYYVHPFHKFDIEKAKKMNDFNVFMAKEFDMEPIEFDYFVANNARDIVDIWGYEYMKRMYIPNQTGGVASVQNKLIYSGNNSEYYPHELVHLYTFDLVPKDYHFWIGEGIATFYGGSGGYSLDWHLEKLRIFLESKPNFDLSDIDKLDTVIPNGEHKTDFRYVIGGFLMKEIYENYGVEGLLEALQIEGGNVEEFHKSGGSNDAFFDFLNKKLGIERNEFDAYIKTELKN
ncbi:hypothetical protein [Maribacter arenosus]|uniref:Peptidase MA superfamily protein n=1 Tax=Maribacter arenosus TaxID=1854708 RepID=A0ABR7VF74_9FLAO|nr:hypothetical protein [Maribacter arenosus]MBD0851961.1 hypothetical protein [Maribacter arenosus]